MNFDLKPISVESIPEALAKVERYRLLSEPSVGSPGTELEFAL